MFYFIGLLMLWPQSKLLLSDDVAENDGDAKPNG